MDIHKKDLILHTYHFRSGLPEEGVTHFVTQGVVFEVTAILPGENERKNLHDSSWENVS